MGKSQKRSTYLSFFKNKILLCFVSLFISFVIWVFFSFATIDIDATSFSDLVLRELLIAFESVLPIIPIISFVDFRILNKHHRTWAIVVEVFLLLIIVIARFRYAMLHWLLLLSVLSGFSVQVYSEYGFSRDTISQSIPPYLSDSQPISEISFSATGKTPHEVDALLNRRIKQANDRSNALFGEGKFHIDTVDMVSANPYTKVLDNSSSQVLTADPF